MINLYERNETDFSHNGIRVLQPVEAIVSEELNGDYSLKLTMPRGFSDIEIEQVVKAPTPKNPQLFRVYNTDIDMLGNPVFYCRHIFYDLLDFLIEDTRPTGDGALAISRILDDTPFTGDSDITKQGTAYYQMMNPVNAILGADNSFITVWGGELERDNFTVRMKSQLGADRGVSIRYRKNLTGLRFVTEYSTGENSRSFKTSRIFLRTSLCYFSSPIAISRLLTSSLPSSFLMFTFIISYILMPSCFYISKLICVRSVNLLGFRIKEHILKAKLDEVKAQRR